jgi:histidinol phosphatase-like PHP family hydrolase
MLLEKISDDIFKRCFTAAAEKGIALELNPNYLKKREFEGYTRNGSLSAIYLDPSIRMLRIGKECGCKFTVGSDAHAMADYDNYNRIYTLTSLLDLGEDDFHPKTR